MGIILLILLNGIFNLVRISGERMNAHKTILEAEQPFDFNNPKYPVREATENEIFEWHFKVTDDAKIKIVCSDIRMMRRYSWTEDCPHVYLGIIDGNQELKFCNSTHNNFVYKSTGPELMMKFVTTKNGTGIFKCTALKIGKSKTGKVIQLPRPGKLVRVEIDGSFEQPLPNLDKQWSFESPKGTRIAYQCHFGIMGTEPICGNDVITFNNGEHDEEICSPKESVLFSKTNRSSIRVQLSSEGFGTFYCTVQAVTGSNPNEYDNVILPEDEGTAFAGSDTEDLRNTSCKCGWTNQNRARIIDGSETMPNEFPWMVHLNILFQINDTYSMNVTCGGAIITARHVLTAAHCLDQGIDIVPPENVLMILAKHDKNRPTGHEITLTAKELFVRDAFLEKGIRYEDIGVIFTKETIDFSKSLIGPICVDPVYHDIMHKPLIVMGWGVTEEYRYSNYLRKGQVIVVDESYCAGNVWDVCTTAKMSSACLGDSGGPVVLHDPETNRFTQISVASRIQGSEFCKGYASSTRIAYFYNWIQLVIKATDPSVNTCHKI